MNASVYKRLYLKDLRQFMHGLDLKNNPALRFILRENSILTTVLALAVVCFEVHRLRLISFYISL
jgi:hypothetical protein